MSRAAASGYRSLSSSSQYLWNRSDLQPVLLAVSKVYGADPEVLATSALDGAALSARPRLSLAHRSPVALGVPVLLLCGAVQLTVVARVGAGLTRQRRAMMRMGVPSRRTVAPMVMAVTTVTVAASALGLVLGWLVGAALGAFVAPLLLDHPTSPLPSIWAPGGVLLTSTGVVGILGSLAAAHGRVWRPRNRSLHLRWGLRIVAMASAGVGVVILGSAEVLEDVLKGAVAVSVALMVAVPDILTGIVHVARLPGLAGQTALRILRADQARARITGAALCVCLAVPASVNVLLASYQHSSAAVSMAAPEQFVLASPDGHPVPEDLPSALGDEARMGQPIPVRMVEGQMAVQISGAKAVMVVRSTADVERLLGRVADPDIRALLDRGGLATFTVDSPTVSLDLDDGRTVSPAARRTQAPESWSFVYGAVMTARGAHVNKVASVPDRWVFTQVSESQVNQAVASLHRRGLDPRLATYHRPPPPPRLPLALQALSLTLVLLAVGVTSSLASGIGREARGRSRQLFALGLPSRFCRRLPMIESALLVGLCTVLATGCAVLPVLLARGLSSTLRLHVPGSWVALWFALMAGLAVLAPLTGLRTLRARDRVADELV